MKVAIVHDWLNQIGGAEVVLEVLHEMYPQAPIYTSMYAPAVMPPAYRTWDIRTSFMQRLPSVTRYHQAFLPLYPFAFESFRLEGYDLLLSNSSAFCHLVRPAPGACHINYCLTPPRFLWNLPGYLERERLPHLFALLLRPVVTWLRRWDQRATERVHHFIGISQTVRARIRQAYGREAAIIYPPVATSRFRPASQVEDFFLVVSRLIPYKRVDVAVQAFNALGLPLVIVGDGRARPTLEDMALANIRFLGRLPAAEVAGLMGRCQALIFPGEEDFGIATVEAQAAGRPVIAYRGGGALETVLEGMTGLLFSPQTPEALAEAVQRFHTCRFDAPVLRSHALGFDVISFRERLASFVAAKLETTERDAKRELSDATTKG